MQTDFKFTTDAVSEAYCWEIVRLMKERYNISAQEAIKRNNRLWKGIPFLGEEDERHHWSLDYWATHIFEFYEHYPPKKAVDP